MRKKEGTRERDEREKAFKREKMLQNRRVVSGEPRRRRPKQEGTWTEFTDRGSLCSRERKIRSSRLDWCLSSRRFAHPLLTSAPCTLPEHSVSLAVAPPLFYSPVFLSTLDDGTRFGVVGDASHTPASNIGWDPIWLPYKSC